MASLSQKRLFLLDMDGTIYLDEQLFDGTLDFLSYVRRIGGRALYLTNNSSRGVESYVDKLRRLGIDACADDFLTSVHATVLHLWKKNYRKIYCFGTRSFLRQLEDAGLPVVTQREEGIDCLCMGFDTELTFQKLEDACILLGGGVDFVATNPDWVCPTWYGYVPDCGSVSEMLFRATGRRPYFIGKPRPDMVYLAMERTGFSPQETVLLGDRLYTDIAAGNNAGIDTALVLSGESTLADVETSDAKPTWVFDDIRAMLTALEQENRQ